MNAWAGLDGQPAGTKAAIVAELEKIKASNRDVLTIVVLGKSGVGKSATVNTLIGEKVRPTNPFQAETLQAAEVKRCWQGLEVCVVDTPGLMDAGDVNQSALKSILQFLKGKTVDVLVYVDRLDCYTVDLTDHLLVKAITKALGKEVWDSAIVALTRSQLTPSDGHTYEEFVSLRSEALERLIKKQAGLPASKHLPVVKVENSSGRCRTNEEGDKILPDGTLWMSKLYEAIASAALSPAKKVEVTEKVVRGPDPNQKWKVLIPVLLVAQVFLVYNPLRRAIEQDKKDEHRNRPKWEVEAEENRRKSSLWK